MAELVKISQLPPNPNALDGTEELPVVQGGNTVKVTTSEIIELPKSSDTVDYDDTGNVVVKGDTVQEALDSIDLSVQNKLSTGIVFGGVGSVVGGVGVGTTVNITAGRGSIIDFTVPTAPIYTSIDFGPYSNVALVNTVSALTWWYIDSSGILQQTINKPTATDFRNRIYLFRTGFTGGAITSLVSVVNPITNTAANLGDLARSIGTIFEEGGRITPNGSNLKLTRASGKLIYWGGGYSSDQLDPHEVILSSASPLSFRMITSTGAPGPFITDVPVGFYESAGSVIPVPGSTSRVTIFTAFQLPSGNVVLQYDNTFYNSLSDAKVAISNGSRTFTPNPAVAQADGITSGFILVASNATSLSNTSSCQILNTNKFGELGGGAAAAEVARWGGIIGNPADQLDLAEYIQDVVGTFVTSGSGISILYNDETNSLEISATSTGSGTPDFVIQSYGVI